MMRIIHLGKVKMEYLGLGSRLVLQSGSRSLAQLVPMLLYKHNF